MRPPFLFLTIKAIYGLVVQLVRTLACHARGRRFEPVPGRHFFVDLFPCNECAKIIIQSGIKNIIYSCDKHANTPSVIASKRLLEECNVKYTQLKIDDDIHIDFSHE